MPYWHYQEVLTWYLHQPESHQLSLHKVAYGVMDIRTQRSDPRFTWVRWKCWCQILIVQLHRGNLHDVFFAHILIVVDLTLTRQTFLEFDISTSPAEWLITPRKPLDLYLDQTAGQNYEYISPALASSTDVHTVRGQSARQSVACSMADNWIRNFGNFLWENKKFSSRSKSLMSTMQYACMTIRSIRV